MTSDVGAGRLPFASQVCEGLVLNAFQYSQRNSVQYRRNPFRPFALTIRVFRGSFNRHSNYSTKHVRFVGVVDFNRKGLMDKGIVRCFDRVFVCDERCDSARARIEQPRRNFSAFHTWFFRLVAVFIRPSNATQCRFSANDGDFRVIIVYRRQIDGLGDRVY